MIFLNSGFTYLFFILLIFLLHIIIFLLFLPLYNYLFSKKNFKNKIYKIIYHYALINDFYLINNLELVKDEEVKAVIDHVLFSNKYIYVIKSKYYDDVIDGKKEDKIWISYDKKCRKEEIFNPLLLNKERCDRFSLYKHLDRTFFISIVVVNNNIKLKNLSELNSFNSYICKIKDLKKLIKSIEKRNVSKFNTDSLDKEVKDIAKEIGRL